MKNDKMRKEVTLLRQRKDESLFDVWESSKEFLKQFRHHGSPIFIQLETFYNVLTPSSWNIFDAFLGGSLLSNVPRV